MALSCGAGCWRGPTTAGAAWVALKTHTADDALVNPAFSTAAWPVAPPTAEGFRYFRILQFGQNSSGYQNLMCAGIELYGRLERA